MMNSLILYIKTHQDVPLSHMNLILNNIIKGPFQFSWEGNFGKLVLEQPRTQYVNLKLSFDAICSDLMDDVSFVIVPRHEAKIAEVIQSMSRTGLYNLTEELTRLLLKNPALREELLTFQHEVSEDILETIKIYLELNMSVNLVAKTMYTHRNTINYRISRFIELTGIDIRQTTNGYYVYTLITWKK